MITAILNAIYYQNIIEQECLEKFKYMKKTYKKSYSSDIFEYSKRCKNAMIKIKILILIQEVFTMRRLKFSKKMGPKSLKNSHYSKKSISLKTYNYVNVNSVFINFSNSQEISLLNKYNEIFSPKPYYEGDIMESKNTDSFNLGENMVTKVHSLMIIKELKSSGRNKIKNFISPQSQFTYKLVSEKKNKIIEMFCMQIVDVEELNDERKKIRKRSSLKNKIIVFLFISSYFILIIMVTSIYNKYEDNIVKICISPLVSVVLIKFFVTQNIMIFVHTFFMFFFGEKFYSDFAKSLNPLGLVFKFVIPAISKTNHKAVLIYRKLNGN